jgi:hypothetical protein
MSKLLVILIELRSNFHSKIIVFPTSFSLELPTNSIDFPSTRDYKLFKYIRRHRSPNSKKWLKVPPSTAREIENRKFQSFSADFFAIFLFAPFKT